MLKLCYVEAPWAWFTSLPLSEQWGDDWDDAPYEHNAGSPYGPIAERGENWQLVKLAWDGELIEPRYDSNNSPWTVQQINLGAIAWLRSWDRKVVISAGVSVPEFKRKVREAGGDVYLIEMGETP